MAVLPILRYPDPRLREKSQTVDKFDDSLRTLVSNMIDIDPADVHVGLPVEVVFEAVDDDFTVPLFRPSAA